MACFRTVADGIVLSVRLTPKSSRDGLEGVGLLADGREVALFRVRAVPADGAANTALIPLLGKAFGVPKSSVEIIAGERSRQKPVRITGATKSIT